MTFDTLVANPGRLTILTALAVEPQQEFVSLRNRTQLTDGNLSSHAKRLATAGMLEIDKQLRDGKPVTTIKLTSIGRSALESHVRRLMAALSHKRVVEEVEVSGPVTSHPSPQTSPTRAEGVKSRAAAADDWVD